MSPQFSSAGSIDGLFNGINTDGKQCISGVGDQLAVWRSDALSAWLQADARWMQQNL